MHDRGTLERLLSPYAVRLPPLSRYALAVVLAGSALLARAAVDPVWGFKLPYIFFFPAIALSGWVGGLGAGVLTTVLCAAGAVVFWLPPADSLLIDNAGDLGGLVVFIAVGLLISALNEGWRRAERERTALLRQERAAHEQAAAAEQQLQFALQAGRLGTWEWQIGPGTVRWSPGLEAIHGLAAGTFPGTFAALEAEVHPDDRERVRAAVRAAVETGGDYQAEYRIVRADGAVRWVEGRGRVYHDEAGRPERMLGICSDVTERRQAEERFRLAVEAAPTAMVVVDRRGTIMLVNALLEQLTGHDRAELVGQSIEFLVPHELRADHAAFRARFFADSQRRPMGAGLELHLLHRDGRAIPVEIGLNPIDTDDGPYVIAAVTDISERRRAEQAVLQARAEAEHANRAKDEFLAVLSHELRNPINAILGWAQILRSASSAHLAPQGLEVIERSARAEAQLVESLLDVSRIVSGKLRLDLAQVDLAEIISAARDVVRPTADVKGISLAVELPSRPVFVTGDAGRLQQVLWNLLSNAVKFTPPGGRVEVTLASTGSEAVLVVHDDGEGISSEFLPRVFGRFTQAEGARDRTRGGLGLGLAIVRELVQAHGGTIEAASPGPDLGSTFTVRLPLAKVPGNEVAAGEVGEATLDLGGIRVLAVDPDVDARQLLAVALSTHGALVRSAASLSEARLLLDADLVDVLVADLPGSDGVALIREIRERGLLDGRGRRLPAIALTGYATAADRDAASAAGYDLHLPKPVAPAELVRAITAVRTHLARQTLAPPSPG